MDDDCAHILANDVSESGPEMWTGRILHIRKISVIFTYWTSYLTKMLQTSIIYQCVPFPSQCSVYNEGR